MQADSVAHKALSPSPWNTQGAGNRRREWKSVERERERLEKKNYRRFRRAFGKQIAAVVGVLRDGEPPVRAAWDAIDKTESAMQEAYEAAYMEAGLFFANRTYGTLKAKPEIERSWIDRILHLVRHGIIAREIRRVQSHTKNLVRQIIQRGIEEGLSIPKIAREIRREWIDKESAISKVRATRIARTETVRASNYGSIEGARSAGEGVKKFWIATPDSRVRETHAEAENQDPIGLDDLFTVGSAQLKYPGDPEGPPEETIQCRCTIGYKTPEA